MTGWPRARFLDRRQLPQTPCVYIVTRNGTDVLYVGRAIRLMKRMLYHLTIMHLPNQEELWVHWFVQREDDLYELEREWMEKLKPPLNKIAAAKTSDQSTWPGKLSEEDLRKIAARKAKFDARRDAVRR